ncbi:HNH endonuclease [Devosia sp. 2618]|uniref:HNH endonuclease n=1 Tax=Devosia sp. 2618 TaxID=3156454 RepID=UPI00339A46B3
MADKRKPLRTLKPRLSAIAPRLKSPREIRDKRYSPDATVRGWYKSARWQALRQEVLARDLYTCQQTGVILLGSTNTPDSPVVDHIKQHHGDPELFWDVNNLQAVTKAWHDSEKQRQERRQR